MTEAGAKALAISSGQYQRRPTSVGRLAGLSPMLAAINRATKKSCFIPHSLQKVGSRWALWVEPLEGFHADPAYTRTLNQAGYPEAQAKQTSAAAYP
jgi:hypothetical protein